MTSPSVRFICTLAGALIIAFWAGGPASAGVYKWVDEGDTTHYTDKPPGETDLGHTLLNAQGVAIGKVDRAKTEQELLDLAQKVEQDFKRQRKEREKQHQDNVLLETFTTERDLLLARDDRLAVLENTILFSKRSIDGWNIKLGDLLDQLVNAGDSSAARLEKIQTEYDQLQSRITLTQGYMFDKMKESKSTTNQFMRDLLRYRELKSIN